MADEIPELIAEVRTRTGKGAARSARREGLVPGVVYGGNTDPLAINIPYNSLLKRLKNGRFLSTLFTLKVEGQEDVRVICRNVQRNVVKDLPTHVDFMRLSRTARVNLFINVNFVGEELCPGLKRGGSLTVVRPEIELRVTAGEIPSNIDVDISTLNVGEIVTISSVNLPAGTKAVIDRDFVIATIQAPSSLKSAGQDDDDDIESESDSESTEETTE
ncbi:MAG: 50S ribosomal protein L25/general stress protein Ctc [Proteobacteria bacterium]|nr:50S ribosomal protein L25/general stress protein Ctc [Pseudomonadota bacterium]